MLKLRRVVALFGLLVSFSEGHAARAETEPALRHVGAITLPGVSGRIDHLAADVDHDRLIVAATGNRTVEVIDLRAGTRLHSLAGLKEPQGVVYLPSFRRAVVADGGGSVMSLDDAGSPRLDKIAPLTGADNVRFDAGEGRLYVGYSAAALAVIDPTHGRRLPDIKLPGRPEAFALDENGHSLYVNVPTKKSVVIVDRLKGTVVSTVTLKSAAANYPLALDEAGHRLFVGTRKPARVVVLDPRDGSVVASFACVADTDDIFYDSGRERIYVSGGEGFVDAFDASPTGRYVRLAHVATAPGARTSLWVPELRRLFVAVPRHDKEDATIHVFEAAPL
jgi:DNA-binding beta-propeller fold protein YncE